MSVATASCSSSATPQQKRIANPVRADSVNATVGNLRLLAARVEAPSDSVHVQDGNVGLFLTVANIGSSDDTLTGATSPDATSIVYRNGTQPIQPTIAVPIPAGGVASLQYPGGPHLELVGLSQNIPGGTFLPVTFTFASAGSIVMNVFVQGFAHPTVSPPTASASSSAG